MRYREALLDPARYFASPQAVLDADSLTREQRIEILRRWHHDALELQVAEEEGMTGGERNWVRETAVALTDLGVGVNPE